MKRDADSAIEEISTNKECAKNTLIIEKNCYLLMKQAQHWAWWSSIFPTELVFIVGRLLYGHDEDGWIHSAQLFLEKIFSLYIEPHTVQVTFRIHINSQNVPLFTQLVIDPSVAELQSLNVSNSRFVPFNINNK